MITHSVSAFKVSITGILNYIHMLCITLEYQLPQVWIIVNFENQSFFSVLIKQNSVKRELNVKLLLVVMKHFNYLFQKIQYLT